MSAFLIVQLCDRLRKGQSTHIPAMSVSELTDFLAVLAFLREAPHG